SSRYRRRASCYDPPQHMNFWARVSMDGPVVYEYLGPCWLWTGPIGTKGYGNAGYWTAHRRAWVLANGPIPRGLHVLHHCDNPPCVRPDHLWLGTAADNVRDRVSKGRSATGLRSG